MSARDVEVRLATAADEVRWRQLWAAYLDVYAQDLAPAVTADTWRRVLAGQDGYRCSLACDAGGEVVGFVHSVPRVSTWSAAPDLYLEDLFVDPAARGRGVGATLIAAVADRARDLGARKVTWETDADNATAQRLYDRLATRSTEVHYTLAPGTPSRVPPAT